MVSVVKALEDAGLLDPLRAAERLDEIEQLRAELERERMRLAACGVVALANTPESAAKARDMSPEYKSASCDEVARAVDREMELRAALAAEKEKVRWLESERDQLLTLTALFKTHPEAYDGPCLCHVCMSYADPDALPPLPSTGEKGDG